MDNDSSFRKKWLYIFVWLFILVTFYLWQIQKMGGIQANLYGVLMDLLCIFPILLLIWMAFFAQFILPVNTFIDRQKIFDRLIRYLLGSHGPAVFVENGVIKEHSGERLRKGPGVVWLDSASGAVTRTAVEIKQTLGPGVHFTKNKEFLAGRVDLHIQLDSIGPREGEKPFDLKNETQSDQEYKDIQERRKQVSALTRDGIEVVPSISINFRVNTGFPKERKPGSRFGYRKGITKREKEREEADKKAIRKAILSEGVNPMAPSDSPRQHVAWNQLPILLAVDVWREYVAKFTLDQLLSPDQIVPASPFQLPELLEEDIDPLSQPIQVSPQQRRMENILVGILRKINKLMDKAIKYLQNNQAVSVPSTTSVPPPMDERTIPSKVTALQVINDMVTARLTTPVVDFLDTYGARTGRTVPSPEFALLQERGLAVVSVSINYVHFSNAIEKQIISNWEASWLKNAKAESERINRQIRFAEIHGQEMARLSYTNALTRHIMKQRPHTIRETLQALMMRTRLFIIRDDQLQRRMNTEREEIERILQHMENGL